MACGAPLSPYGESRADPLIGVTLPGGYRITRLIGIGGMGRVYCADQVALQRTVAVKVIHPQLADDELAAARFLIEARAASRLSHPNSVAIFDFGRTGDGHAYIVMEYLRGRDLGRVAQTEGPLPFRRIVNVLQQALAALGEAHALGIVHRDVKPDNIILEPLRSGLDFVKVVDFGLAKLLNDGLPALGPSQSRPGIVCGTPEYMSPEQSRGDRLDGRSDLYSVGVILFELLTGKLPFVGETQNKTLILQLTEPPPDPREIAPQRQIPASFARVVMRALAKSREERMLSAADFTAELQRALSDVQAVGALDAMPVTAIRCGSCGRLTPVGERFCVECGSAITRTPVPPAVAAEVLRRSESSSPPRRHQPAAGIRLTKLVAREDAIRWLENRRLEARCGPTVAHLVGEPGMGKTRLIQEVVKRWSVEGDAIVCVRPDPTWARVGDAAARSAICSLMVASGQNEPSLSSHLQSAGADAQNGLKILFEVNPPTLGGDERRLALAEALRWSLERAQARFRDRGLTLVVDDIDFVDGTSCNVFADFLSHPARVPVLVVIAYCPNARPVGDPSRDEAWRLGPLPYSSVASILSPLVGRHEALSPLHLEQLLAWSDETSEPPPEQLGVLMARRIERLPHHARLCLQAVAVWGDGATLEILSRILGSGIDPASGVDGLRRARMVRAESDGLYVEHALVRTVALSSISVGRKRELYARCRLLRPDAPLEVRANDARHGASTFEALTLLDELAAARRAHGDPLGAVSALRHALDLSRQDLHVGEMDDSASAVLVFSRKLAEALVESRRWADADGVLREALDSAPPNSAHRAHLLGVMAQVANVRRHPGEARYYLDEAMRVARRSDAPGLLPLLEELDRAIAVA